MKTNDHDFYEKINRFNEIYNIGADGTPKDLGIERLRNFMDILMEEVKEGDDLIAKYHALKESNELSQHMKVEILTELSDWLGDIMVYCASEAVRWGLPIKEILEIIMESNFSKLGENGEVIRDHRGKVLKGPNYWKPEPKISKLIQRDGEIS